MITLKANTETIQLTTSSTANIDYSCSFVDVTTTTFTPSSSEEKLPRRQVRQLLPRRPHPRKDK